MRGQVQDLGDRAHLGLGLYIARLTVEAHGGEIAATSDEKTGTTFTIQLPRTYLLEDLRAKRKLLILGTIP
jgi:signal transduction histidine kinase